MTIRKLIAAAALAALATPFVATTASAETQWQKDHPRRTEVNARLANQNKRINNEVAQYRGRYIQAILDLRELDVKCELTPQQADDVALGQPVEVWGPDREGAPSIGRLIFIASVADRKSELVPVLVRLRNSEQRLRCGVSVSVRFPPGPAVYGR